jgi:hypothetical protein
MLRWLLNGMARVSAFTVHEPPESGGTPFERAESLAFVEDGFSWLAALFAPIYLIVRGEWLALAAYTVAALVLMSILSLVGASDNWIGWMFLLLNIVTGFELSAFKRWSLSRAGWREIATVSGRGREEAERRFFEDWLPVVSSDGAAIGALAHRATKPDLETRVEDAVQRLAGRLRAKFLPNA